MRTDDGLAQRWRLAVADARPQPEAMAGELSFPVEGYPEILAAFDPDDFGLAIKLGGAASPDDEDLLQTVHATWLAAYGDDGYRHGGVAYDPVHRAAHFWVDRLVAPGSATDCVDRLLWLVGRLAEIVPVEHARVAPAEPAAKYGALLGADGPPFVLAGNPLASRLHDDGEAAAFAWAQDQTSWAPAELAAMIAELVVELDPVDPDTAALALRLCDRGLAIDPSHADLCGYRLQILVVQERVAEAVDHARQHPILLAHLVGLVAETTPADLSLVCDALAPAELAAIAATDALVQPLLVDVGRHAPERLPGLLATLPRAVDLAPQLRAAAHELEGPARTCVEAVVRSWPVRGDR